MAALASALALFLFMIPKSPFPVSPVVEPDLTHYPVAYVGVGFTDVTEEGECGVNDPLREWGHPGLPFSLEHVADEVVWGDADAVDAELLVLVKHGPGELVSEALGGRVAGQERSGVGAAGRTNANDGTLPLLHHEGQAEPAHHYRPSVVDIEHAVDQTLVDQVQVLRVVVAHSDVVDENSNSAHLCDDSLELLLECSQNLLVRLVEVVSDHLALESFILFLKLLLHPGKLVLRPTYDNHVHALLPKSVHEGLANT
eukprot:CAMPEP_0118648512 /NCGR_PEP_ID=MMETSP0785-20121206/9196_1 /TAXON_ID=91992 /ORGANISM="Bolidomonas pacifica, Strain CCMP 1866" /LENGTH=255 /DNA_ID=CAMNT_0006540711 /DNA_START=26 /DNA_END=792 /DNA_ORIENTATION=+